MQRTVWTAATIAVVVLLAGARGSGADVDSRAEEARRGCSERTLKGTYSIQIQGTQPAGPSGPTESVVGVVIRDYDGRGTFTQVDNVKGSISGWAPDREGFGTYEVNPDCTAVVYLEPAPGIVLEERLVIVNGGREAFGAVTQLALVMVTSVHRRIRD